MISSQWNPKVSIIIPVYNGSNYMREAIDSALAQTYQNIEVIVINDGSTDGGETDSIASSYGERIKYIKKENGGVSSALNMGIKNMTGEYFSWLSHDDVYGPNKIMHQINSLSRAEKKDAVSLCAHYFINEKSERLAKKAPNRFLPGIYTWKQSLSELLSNGTFSGCALLIPKSALNECGCFHEGLRFSQDILMWMTILLNQYSLVYNPDEDVYSRIHGKQLTQTGRKLFQKDSLTIGDLVISKLIEASDSKNNFLLLFAKRNAKYGNREVVKACIDAGRPLKLLNMKQRTSLKLQMIYGDIRPILRKIYYRIFVNAK